MKTPYAIVSERMITTAKKTSESENDTEDLIQAKMGKELKHKTRLRFFSKKLIRND